jgi:pimeloyl-ACP methyl ester carboxylesterase
MARDGNYQPVPPREAFAIDTPDSRRSQAALLLCIGAAVGGKTRHLPREREFPLPPLRPLASSGRISLARALRRLDVPAADYVGGFRGRIAPEVPAQLTAELYERPAPYTAAAIVEAGLHSPYRIVRTAGAIAALDTTGPRPDVIAELVESAQVQDIDIRELARTGLARAQPDHPLLQKYVTGPRDVRQRREPSNTAVISHGTWASNSDWWRPGGEFYEYLDTLTPSLHLHDKSFAWSGDYSHAQRKLAAAELKAWVSAEQLNRPDYFAHSHGGTVANLATQDGLKLGRLVFLSLPVHSAWLPKLANVTKIIDIRVHSDLVILADLGGQRLPPSLRNSPKVKEARNGWFSHSASHEPSYWQQHGLPALL